MSRSRGIGVVLVVLAVAAGGCGGSGDDGSRGGSQPDKLFSESELEAFYLRGADLPEGYEKKQSRSGGAGECLQAETREEAASASQMRAFGLVACAGSKYEREVRDGDRRASNDVGTAAFAFRDPRGASKALPVIRKDSIADYRATGDARVVSRHSIPVSGLGDEPVRGARIIIDALPLGELRAFMYFWRSRNVVAVLFSTDATDDLDEHTTLDIAKKIDYRASDKGG